jgi:uncharacterized cupredoxin-like copper-binding protein
LTYRTRSTVLIVLGAAIVALIAWAFALAPDRAAAQARAHAAPKVTIVSVQAGKPSELSFTLSKFSNLPVGTITFRVTNKGSIAHNFKVCSVAVATPTQFACAGKGTPMIQPGKSATLTLTLKKGKYEYLCTVPGHASAGMKGLFGVGVAVSAKTSTSVGVSASGSGSGGSGSTGATGAKCTSPTSSTVTVSAFDFGYTVSPSTVPCGTITFNVTNAGNADHDFVVEGLIGQDGRTNLLGTGQSQSISTSSLTPGTWTYYCSVPTHRGLGMEGKLTVTGG